jgi:hypothetical protein
VLLPTLMRLAGERRRSPAADRDPAAVPTAVAR